MKVGLLGVDFYSNNRGCGALGYSAVQVLYEICKECNEELEVFAVLFISEPVPTMDLCNVVFHCYKIRPKKMKFWNDCKTIFNQCDIILDFTGGDSFTDMYGIKRFVVASLIKEVAIKSKAKFIMAPQTIGPFSSLLAIKWARRILEKCDYVFVRDALSSKYAKELFDISTLISTDVAFSLPYVIQSKITSKKIKIGFNPSGLLWSGTKNFSADKHLKVDYVQYIQSVMDVWCKDDNIEVHLIPHVFTYDGIGSENDMKACIDIHNMYPNTFIESSFDTPMEIKSYISTMDVFIGARMHATIAAFSSKIATIPFSYSRKFEGLYGDLNYPYLIRATQMSTEEAIEKTIKWTNEYDVLKENVIVSHKLLTDKKNVFADILKKYVGSK